MLFFVGAGFGAAISTALLEAREGSNTTILPFYVGDSTWSHFSDALLPSILVLLAGLATTLIARLAPPPTIDT
jgi:hypothetical protein